MKKSSPFLISKTVPGKQQKSAVRGSFLVRDQATLSKLAGLTKGSSGEVNGDTATVSVKTAKAKNFVFATLTEEEHEVGTTWIYFCSLFFIYLSFFRTKSERRPIYSTAVTKREWILWKSPGWNLGGRSALSTSFFNSLILILIF